MYNRFDLAVHSNENLNSTLSIIQNNTSFLNDYAKLLKKVFILFMTQKYSVSKVSLYRNPAHFVEHYHNLKFLI